LQSEYEKLLAENSALRLREQISLDMIDAVGGNTSEKSCGDDPLSFEAAPLICVNRHSPNNVKKIRLNVIIERATIYCVNTRSIQ
jgi:hypothetical protein